MWFVVALISFFFLALAAVVDKFLLTKTRIVPLSYAFYIAALGGLFSSFLIFFEPDFYLPEEYLLILIVGGAAFYLAIYFMYLAVKEHEVSKINPLVISLIPLIIFLLSFFLAIEPLSFKKLFGTLLLIGGSYFLSQTGLPKTRLKPKVWGLVLLSCIMFAVANSFNKLAYNNLSFITAFVWLRWFSLIAAVIATTILNGWSAVFSVGGKKPSPVIQQIYRAKDFVVQYSVKCISIIFDIEARELQKTRRQWLAFGIGQAAGAVGVISMQYAIKLGNVILVTALNGIQFFFVISIVYILSKFYPKIMRENIEPRFIRQKIFWSAVLGLGVLLILV